MRTVLLSGVMAFAVAGCSGSSSGGDGGDPCPLDSTERAIVEEVVFETILNAHTTAEHNVGTERSWGFSLPASTVGNNGFFFDVAPCTVATTLAPYCFAALEPDPPAPFFEEHDACVRLGCEQAGVALIDAYFTLQPQMEPEPRHLFPYETDQPAGVAEIAENPWIRFRVELLGSASNRVTASLDFDVTIDPDDHAAIDLDHSGTILAENTDLDVHTVAVDLAFTGLGVDASFTLGSGGALTLAGETLATIADEPAPFTWSEGCD